MEEEKRKSAQPEPPKSKPPKPEPEPAIVVPKEVVPQKGIYVVMSCVFFRACPVLCCLLTGHALMGKS